MDLDKSGVVQNVQVLGDGLLGHIKALGDLVNRARAIANELEDRSSARLGESRQGCFGIHGPSLSHCLYKR